MRASGKGSHQSNILAGRLFYFLGLQDLNEEIGKGDKLEMTTPSAT